MPYQPPQFRPPRRHELAGLKYYRTASAYNWLGVAMAHPTRAIELLMEQCEPDVLSPMFEIEIDAILRQADKRGYTLNLSKPCLGTTQFYNRHVYGTLNLNDAESMSAYYAEMELADRLRGYPKES
ncbi:hypothetical protein P3795_31705 [Pseudomonas aeruginosa]|nr:hypothetical protein [Pseudomonas aeruginosa]MDP5521420.1 hypothetical protein [Pseudomonas aeruginosa]